MCEYSGKLVALLDGELESGEAIEVERHLCACAECRNQLRMYERLGNCIDAYCEAKLGASAPRGAAPLRPALLGAGAAAMVTIVALLVVVPRMRNAQPSPGVTRPMTVQTAVSETPRHSLAAVKKTHRRPVAAPAQIQETSRQPAEPDIQIAIPADAVLPPGAVPEGVTFVANMRIVADGSARQSFVWP
jgi:anti-sigma factor RsiW